MIDLRIASISREYVRVSVAAEVDGVAVDPRTAGTGGSAWPVRMALTAPYTRPVEADWRAAGWESQGQPVARLRIGPGGEYTPAPGSYDVWIEVDAGTAGEKPVKRVGTLEIV